jgi:predicted metalloprotease with PDZ domain
MIGVGVDKLVRLIACCMLLTLLTMPGVASAAEAVRHSLEFPDDREQIILVQSEFPVNLPVTELIMPNWTPGSYQIKDFAANVNQLSAVSADGRALSLHKTEKDRWQVDTSQTDKLLVSYEVFTPKLNVRSSWASREFSLINGASVFLYTSQSRELPQILSIMTDADRGYVFTALTLAADGSGHIAENYDELVDSPVAVARAPFYRFNVGDQDYILLNVGENEFWDGEQAAADVKKIVAQTQLFWQSNPLEKPYWFLNFIVDGGGGLEHDNSTVTMTGRRQMRDRESYIGWLGLMAHEFFHVWNVRKMRPADLEKYDYQNEQYTSQLWLAEGLTSYFDNLLMSRAELITPEEYLALLAKDIHRLETTPGRLAQTVTEASHDAWIRQYKPNSNTVNSTISYYTKGAIIGFVLDTYIRKESKGRRNLDEVMRKMYSLYSNRPYSNDAFEKIVVEVGGPGAGRLLNNLLSTTAELDVDAALDWYGLKLDRGESTPDDSSDPSEPKSGLGVTWDDDQPDRVVKTVLAGSAGAMSGLMPGDEILAIGNERLTEKRLSSLMSSFRPGQQTTLLVSRRNKIITLDIKLDTAIPEHFGITRQANFKKSHIKHLQSLLGQDLGQ